jgi:hypothetical protein
MFLFSMLAKAFKVGRQTWQQADDVAVRNAVKRHDERIFTA